MVKRVPNMEKWGTQNNGMTLTLSLDSQKGPILTSHHFLFNMLTLKLMYGETGRGPLV